MNKQFEKVGLANIGGGVAEELFSRELNAIMRNIEDPNTDPKATRKLTLEFAIKPSENRDACAVEVKCRSSMPGVKPVAATIFLGKEGGRLVAYENNMRQELLPLGGKVSPIGGGEAVTNA